MKTTEILASYGIIQPWKIRFWPFLLVVIVAGFVLLIHLGNLLAIELSYEISDVHQTTAKDITTAMLATGAFIVGYHQWRAARQEVSMDKFYDRLNTANTRLATLPGVNPFHMYVYAELDNLEYVVEKYRLGYMSPEQAIRGLLTFRSRLTGGQGKEFTEYVQKAVKDAAYSHATELVVERAINGPQ